MIPLRDNIRSGSFPLLTLVLIAVNVIVFFEQISLSQKQFLAFVQTYGLVPAKFFAAAGKGWPAVEAVLPLVSNLFLHGGWMHLIGNMWYLWIFSDNVEDLLGRTRYLLFYICCGIAANFAQLAIDPDSTVPTIGASGAISGILGAYLVSFPRARILTLIPLFLLFPVIEIPALLFLGFWFFLQLQYGTASLLMAGSNIAWWAHIGGFVAGMILIRFFRPARQQPRY